MGGVCALESSSFPEEKKTSSLPRHLKYGVYMYKLLSLHTIKSIIVGKKSTTVQQLIESLLFHTTYYIAFRSTIVSQKRAH